MSEVDEVFFFNDTATTEIYTGEDTLSLHERSSDLFNTDDVSAITLT